MKYIDLANLNDNPYQTRLNYEEQSIIELAEDIRAQRPSLPTTLGLLQPPVGRNGQGDIVELAFGHRRKRAFSHLAETYPGEGWDSMPVEVADLSDEQMADLAWSENEKRRDISAVERAIALQRAITDFGYSLTEAAKRRGIAKSTASNLLRLLDLPDEVQAMVRAGDLTERQARELLPLVQLVDRPKEAIKIADSAIEEEWSALAVEYKARDIIYKSATPILPAMTTWIEAKGAGAMGLHLPDGCREVCGDCEYYISYKKQAMCKDKALCATKENAWRDRLEELASQRYQVPIRRSTCVDPQGLAIAKSYNGGGCINLSVGYAGWAYKSEPVDSEALPNIYYTCSLGYKCECMANARECDTPPDDDPKRAERIAWINEQNALAAKVIDELRSDLKAAFQAALAHLDPKQVGVFNGLLATLRQSRGSKKDQVAEGLTNALLNERPKSRQGDAQFYAATVRELCRLGTPLAIVEAVCQMIEEKITEEALGGHSYADWYLGPRIEQAYEILKAHPGHDDLRARLDELVSEKAQNQL